MYKLMKSFVCITTVVVVTAVAASILFGEHYCTDKDGKEVWRWTGPFYPKKDVSR